MDYKTLSAESGTPDLWLYVRSSVLFLEIKTQ